MKEQKSDCRKYWAEFVGTAILTFVSLAALVFTDGNFLAAALAFGLTYIAMAYSIGRISGSHLNPAVSTGMVITRRMSVLDYVWYIICQVVGALVGAALLFALIKLMGEDATGNMGQAFYAIEPSEMGSQIILTMILEIVLSFIFVLTFLGATGKSESHKTAGVVAGLMLMALIVFGTQIIGTHVNPAQSLAAAIFAGADALKEVWLFIIAPLIGAVLAAIAARFMFASNEEPARKPAEKPAN